MRNVLTMVLVMVVAAVSGCAWFDGDGGGGFRPASAKVTCADVRNPDSASACNAQASGAFELISSAWADTVFNRGEVSRGEGVHADLEVVSGSSFQGYVEARFDAGCGGDGQPWVIVPKQAVEFVSGQPMNFSVSGTCGDMPLGSRQLTVTAWGSDGETVLDAGVVTFTLVE